MLRYLTCGLGLIFLLMTCKTDPTNSSIKAGTQITQSAQFDQDSIFWNLTDKEAGLIINTQEDLSIDFQGAFIAGKTFGQEPDQHQGTAIRVVNAKTLRILNAHFSAFQQGIVVENVDQLIIENCSFSHFNRSSIGKEFLFKSIGLSIKKATSLRLNGVSFKHLDQALQLGNVAQVMIDQSSFSWLRQGVIYASDLEALTISNSHLLYLGLPEIQSKFIDIDFSEVALGLNNNDWAHVQQADFADFLELQETNQWAYLTSIPEKQWNKPQIDSLLLSYGVTTPELVLLDEWGIYDHTYPRAWFRQSLEASDVFLLTAPPGNWRLVGGNGYGRIIPKTGTFPTTLRAQRSAMADSFSLEFEYLGKPTQRFNKPYKPLDVYLFRGNPPNE